MKIKWHEVEAEKTKAYEAIVWENGNSNLLDKYYTTKAEAVKAVKTCKKNYKGNGELDCYVRYLDYDCGLVLDYEL